MLQRGFLPAIDREAAIPMRAGVPRSAAMNMTGHKTEAVYRRYAIVDEAMLREGAEKLAAFHSSEENAPRNEVPLRRKDKP